MRLSHLQATTMLIASAFVGGTSCNALKSVDKVEKSTAEVGLKMDETNGEIEETNRKMDEMKNEMGEMNDKLIETNQRMENMNKALERMYQDLRQGDSLSARLQTIEKMSDAASLKGKTVYAAQYFMSFEYQLWKGEGSDGIAFRELLKRDAVDEFIQTLRRFAPTSLPIDALSSEKDLLSIEALAMTSHMLNSNSAFAMNKKNYGIASMHSLLKDSLEYGQKLASGTLAVRDIPEFAQFALRDPELVKYIFELRINMLPCLVLNELSEVASDKFVNKWKARASTWLLPWNADLSSKNELEIREYITWLSWADADLEFLNSLGVVPRVDPLLLKVLRNARFVDQSRFMSSPATALRVAAVSELKDALDKFLGQIR